MVFFCEFCEVFKNTYFTEHLRTTASAFQYTLVLFTKKNSLIHNTEKSGDAKSF